VLGLAVLPVPGGVVDELVVRTPEDLGPATLVADIRAEGGRCVGVTPADLRSLVDLTTAALRAVARMLDDPAAVADAVRTVLAADSAGFESAGPNAPEVPEMAAAQDPAGAPAAPAGNGHRLALDTGNGAELVARRGWAPFTDVEVARVAALGEVLAAAAVQATAPVAVLTTDGAGLVLRGATPADAEAVTSLHNRCSAQTLFARYHAGVRTLPRRLLDRLLSPPRGTTVLALCGTTVVGLAQLIRTTTPDEAEISLLIEDDWQGRGLGTAMLRRLAILARAAGHREIIAWCLPSELAFARTATSSGLPMSVRREADLVRISLRVTAECFGPAAEDEDLVGGRS
jgi:GNAT superfamily N-acetyltransferase